jgi:hypothetical protein
MSASLVKLNANMEEFLSLFCTLLTSEAHCESAATSASAAPMQATEEITSQDLAPPAIGAAVDPKPMNEPSGLSTHFVP